MTMRGACCAGATASSERARSANFAQDSICQPIWGSARPIDNAALPRCFPEHQRSRFAAASATRLRRHERRARGIGSAGGRPHRRGRAARGLPQENNRSKTLRCFCPSARAKSESDTGYARTSKLGRTTNFAVSLAPVGSAGARAAGKFGDVHGEPSTFRVALELQAEHEIVAGK